MSLPESIGGYEIQRVLGSGGMATVYAALQRQPRRTVAVKVMRHAGMDKTMLRRFHREIEILGRLRHPFIGQVFGAGVHEAGGESQPYFVMEYVPGARTITEYCEHRGLNLRERVKLFVKVCAGVEHGHHRKVIHRDLKPGNVLVDEQGEPKIIDYGVARFCETEVHDARTVNTDPGRLTGTIQYMAPEQIDSHEQDLDARCDVYALGVILYKLLTKRHPYELSGLTVFAAARIIQEQMPPAPSSLEHRIGRDLETIVLKALAKDRRNRYASAGSLGRDLLRWLTHTPINARRVSPWWRAMLFVRRHRTEAVAVAVVAFVVGLAFVGLAVQRQQLARSMNRELELVRRGNGSAVEEVIAPVPLEPLLEEATGSVEAEQDPSVRQERSPRLLSQLSFPPQALVATPGSSRLLAVAVDGRISLVDVRRARTLWTRDEERGDLLLARLVQEGAVLVTVSEDGTIRVSNADSGDTLRTLGSGLATCLSAAVDRGGRSVALSGDDLTLRMVELSDGRSTLLRGTRGAYAGLFFRDDGNVLLAMTAHGEIDRWRRDGETWRMEWLPGRLTQKVYGLAMASANDGLIVVSGEELWWTPPDRPASPERRTSLEVYGLPPVIAMDAQRGLLGIRYERQVHIIDVRTGYMVCDPLERTDGREPVAFAFVTFGAEDENLWLAVADQSGTLLQLPINLDE